MKTLCLTAAMLIVSAAIGLESAAQCTTYAGTLNLAPFSACEGNPITAVHNGDYVLDTNDVFAYIVHDGSGTYPYTAIVSGSDATFSDADIPGIVYGQTYYIAAVAGNDDGSGFPDPLDYCYSQSAGVEVVWNQMPNPDAGEDFFVCGKTTCLNAVQSPGTTGLWITLPGVSYDDNTDPQTCVTVNLLDTLDFMWCESNSFCSWCDTVSVAFFQDIEAEQQVYFPGDWPDDIIPNCGLVFTELDANDYISYPTATGYWIDTVPGLQVFYNPGTPRDSAQVAQYGLHCFYWILENGVNFDGTPVCRDSSEAVCVHFYQRPVADAGEDDIACGYEYRLNAQSTGMFQGIWSSDYDDAYFHYNSQPNSTMPYDSVHVQVLSYDLNPNYYEFYWQEDSGWEIPNFECSDNDTVRIVFAARPGGVFFYNNPACHGSNATLWADLTDPAVDQNLSLFVWDFGNNVDSVIYGNGNPTGYGQHEVWWDIVNHPDDTMHSVWLQVTSEYGCMSYKHYDTVAEPQRMSPHIDVTPATCGLSNGTIELSTGNNTYTFTWVDDRIANPADTTVSGLTGGPPCYMLALTAQAEDQITYPGIYCYDTQSVYVPDTGYVTALFDTLPFVFQGTPPVADYDSVVPAVITLFDESSGDIEFWLWRFYNANGNLVSFIDEDSNTVSWTSSQYPTVTFMAQGVYTVRLIVESSFGCSDEFLWGPFYVIDGSFIYTVTGDEPGLLVFPNPCNDILNIESSRNTSEQATIEIFSESGRLLSAESNLMPADSRIGLDVSDLNEGVFFLRITSGRSVYVKRFVRLNAVK